MISLDTEHDTCIDLTDGWFENSALVVISIDKKLTYRNFLHQFKQPDVLVGSAGELWPWTSFILARAWRVSTLDRLVGPPTETFYSLLTLWTFICSRFHLASIYRMTFTSKRPAAVCECDFFSFSRFKNHVISSLYFLLDSDWHISFVVKTSLLFSSM